jgi:hypothetical protein
MKEAIFEMYKTISVGKNEICKVCNKDKKLEKPLSIYFIGEQFNSSKDTILFVGKTAVGGEEIGDFIDDTFTDATDFGKISLNLTERYSRQRAFYFYTNEIVKRHYGSYDEGCKSIALTNIVKCNNASTIDKTTNSIKDNCINKLGIIWKEVEILNPKRIIFYTGRHYDDFINNFRPVDFSSYIDIAHDENSFWWHRQFKDKSGKTICDVLRIYHPDYIRHIKGNPKEQYISKVVTWLKQTV